MFAFNNVGKKTDATLPAQGDGPDIAQTLSSSCALKGGRCRFYSLSQQKAYEESIHKYISHAWAVSFAKLDVAGAEGRH